MPWKLVESVEIVRRIGAPPPSVGSALAVTCPDIFEPPDGNFATIGTERADALDSALPMRSWPMEWLKVLATIAKWLAKIVKERERTARGALDGNARTARYIAILLARLLSRAVIVGILAVLAITIYVIWRLV